MERIFVCKRCGAQHLIVNWEDVSINRGETLAANRSVYYCPSCEQANVLEEIDIMTNLFEQRFWPYYLDKNQVLDQHPEMSNWF